MGYPARNKKLPVISDLIRDPIILAKRLRGFRVNPGMTGVYLSGGLANELSHRI